MELFAILLSGLLGVLSPVNLVVDKIVESNLRSRLNKVEQLQVRVDNAPNYQLVQGKVERVRIGGRGLWLTPEIRIGALELETDPVNVNIQRLRQGGGGSPRSSLREPLQAAVRLVLTQVDINRVLQSPAVASRLQRLWSGVFGGSPERYQILNPRVEFLGEKRFRFQMEVQEQDAEALALTVESGLGITAGRSLQLVEPAVLINGRPLSPALTGGFSRGISDRFNLRTLEDAGIIARLLKLDITTGELEIAAFVRVDAPK
jgi:hypothetical protein